MKIAFVLLGLSIIAGCRDAPPPPVQAPEKAPVAIRPPEVSPALITMPAEVAGSKLSLHGEGLRVSYSVSGALRTLAFGLPQSETTAALSAILRAKPSAEESVSECGARMASWANGLTVWFVDERFAGWSVQPGSTALRTIAGVGIGSSRRELDKVYKIELVPESTLGVEFLARGVSGVLSGEGADAKVTHLWAGNTCIAR